MLKDELKDRDDKILALQIAYNAAKEAACKLKNVLGQNKLKGVVASYQAALS